MMRVISKVTATYINRCIVYFYMRFYNKPRMYALALQHWYQKWPKKLHVYVDEQRVENGWKSIIERRNSAYRTDEK